MSVLKSMLCSSLILSLAAVIPAVQAQDLIKARIMSLELARDIARGTLEACQKDGYQVAVVVTDRSGDPLVVYRDVYASKFNALLAQGKANAVVLSTTSSAALRANMADIKDELNELDGLFVMAGGLPIRAAGSLVGAVGVSGAPGGDKDEDCARKGIEAVELRLEFAE
ncbi:MAG: heme-binding protein [Gammaproteobacteria bacterium]|jgi:uncharacterized protein GlcG (DUF336 family)